MTSEYDGDFVGSNDSGGARSLKFGYRDPRDDRYETVESEEERGEDSGASDWENSDESINSGENEQPRRKPAMGCCRYNNFAPRRA